jgi:hypothetical protein
LGTPRQQLPDFARDPNADPVSTDISLTPTTISDTSVPISTFGPENNLIPAQFNPVPSERLLNQQTLTSEAAQQLATWTPPESLAVTSDAGYQSYASNAQDVWNQALAAVNDLSLPEFQQLAPADQSLSKNALEQAMSSIANSQVYIDQLGQLQMDIGTSNPVTLDPSQAQNLMDMAVQQMRQIQTPEYQQVTPADYSQAQGMLEEAQRLALGANIPTIAPAPLPNFGYAQGQLGQAESLIGGVGLQQFGAVAPPNTTQAQNILNSALGAAQAAPGAITEYGNIPTTSRARADSLINQAQSLLGGISLGGQTLLGAPSTAQAEAWFQDAASRAQGAQLQDFEGVEPGTYEVSPGAEIARGLTIEQMHALQGLPTREALAMQMMGLIDENLGDQRDLGIRQTGQAAAALGRLGSGMTTTSLGDLELQIQRVREQEATRLSAETAAKQIDDELAKLDAFLAAGGQMTQEDLANAQMLMALRDEARRERDFFAQQDLANQQLQLQGANTLLGAGTAQYGTQLSAAQFNQAEQARRDAYNLNAANLDMSRAMNTANLGAMDFSIGQGVTAENFQNRALQMQQDAARANALLGSSGAQMAGVNPALNIAQMPYMAAMDERAFQANRDLQGQQLALPERIKAMPE